MGYGSVAAPDGSSGNGVYSAEPGSAAVVLDRYHNASMPNVLVRDVPAGVHATLQRRAAQRGQSLQQYLAGELKRLAEKPSMEEVLDRIDRRRGGRVGLDQAVEDLTEERQRG